MRFLAKLFKVSVRTIHVWIKSIANTIPTPEVGTEIQEIELDEMWHYLEKTRKLWLLKAYDRASRKTIAWVTGRRDIATMRRLYSKLKHLKNRRFYTDDWDAFAAVLPKERHFIGKQYTQAIESDNSNTRHHLGRFTRRTKVVSRSEESVNHAIKLWVHVQNTQVFHELRDSFLSLFK